MLKLGKPKDEDIYVEEYEKGNCYCGFCRKDDEGIERTNGEIVLPPWPSMETLMINKN